MADQNIPNTVALGGGLIQSTLPETYPAKEFALKLQKTIDGGPLGCQGYITPSALIEFEDAYSPSILVSGPLGAFVVTIQPIEAAISHEAWPGVQEAARELETDALASITALRRSQKRHRRVLRFYPEQGSAQLIFWRRVRALSLSDFSVSLAWVSIIQVIQEDVNDSVRFARPKRKKDR